MKPTFTLMTMLPARIKQTIQANSRNSLAFPLLPIGAIFAPHQAKYLGRVHIQSCVIVAFALYALAELIFIKINALVLALVAVIPSIGHYALFALDRRRLEAHTLLIVHYYAFSRRFRLIARARLAQNRFFSSAARRFVRRLFYFVLLDLVARRLAFGAGRAVGIARGRPVERVVFDVEVLVGLV
jgi:hypothetical protein